MDVRDKLRKYLDDRGTEYKWFAESIGMSPSIFYLILSKKKPIPKKYWKAIILLTDRKITLNDLAGIHFEDEEQKPKRKNPKYDY